MTEIVFLVEDDSDGGYTARPLDELIFTQADVSAFIRCSRETKFKITFAAPKVAKVKRSPT